MTKPNGHMPVVLKYEDDKLLNDQIVHLFGKSLFWFNVARPDSLEGVNYVVNANSLDHARTMIAALQMNPANEFLRPSLLEAMDRTDARRLMKDWVNMGVILSHNEPDDPNARVSLLPFVRPVCPSVSDYATRAAIANLLCWRLQNKKFEAFSNVSALIKGGYRVSKINSTQCRVFYREAANFG